MSGYRELQPTDGHKSFYGKALVLEENGEETLLSYGQEVAVKDATGLVSRIWDGWTATTGRHVKAFCGMNKRQFEALPLGMR